MESFLGHPPLVGLTKVVDHPGSQRGGTVQLGSPGAEERQRRDVCWTRMATLPRPLQGQPARLLVGPHPAHRRIPVAKAPITTLAYNSAPCRSRPRAESQQQRRGDPTMVSGGMPVEARWQLSVFPSLYARGNRYPARPAPAGCASGGALVTGGRDQPYHPAAPRCFAGCNPAPPHPGRIRRAACG